MRREELRELHYITPIANVPSILRLGLLSHRRAASIPHTSVADPVIQDRRVDVRLPGGRPLHDYVNLYFHARNPMLYKRKALHATVCVLRVATAVLDLPGVVIADRNASSDWVRFSPSPAGLALVDRDLVYAEYWTNHQNQRDQYRHTSIKCAEVLVPNVVQPHYITGAYVSGNVAWQQLAAVAGGLRGTVDAHLFFQ